MMSDTWRAKWGPTARKAFYRGVLPVVTTVYLMLVSNIWPRPLVMDSKGADLLVRALLTVWYCGVSFGSSRPMSNERLRQMGLPSVSGEDSDCLTRAWWAGLCVMAFVVVTIMTAGIVRTFLPGLSAYSNVIGIAYGLAFAAPAVLRR